MQAALGTLYEAWKHGDDLDPDTRAEIEGFLSGGSRYPQESDDKAASRTAEASPKPA